MNYSESVVSFECDDEQLVGILSVPANSTKQGVVIIVGGPQYRVGSHRQFVLLARALAQQGMTVLRFDYRGMGDSAGDIRDFNSIGNDIAAAVDKLIKAYPNLERIVLWGLCDAASASLFYAHKDSRISGLVLANPWVRSTAGEAQAYIKHYYRSRFMDKAFWKKLLSGQYDFRGSLSSFFELAKKAVFTKPPRSADAEPALSDKMFDCWMRFKGGALVLISGDDLTAKEFSDTVAASHKWRDLFGSGRVQQHTLPSANHTFSRAVWRDEVATITARWIQNH